MKIPNLSRTETKKKHRLSAVRLFKYFFNMSFNINLLIGGTPCRGCVLFHKRWFALVGSKFSDYNLNKSLNRGNPLSWLCSFP